MNIEQAIAIALAHQRKGELREAEAICRQVLAEQSDHAEALHLLGGLAFATNHFAAAVELIEQAAARSPGNAKYHADLGQALMRAGRKTDAETVLRRSLELKTDQPEVLHDLGDVNMDLGRWANAADWYRRAIALRPDWFLPHHNLAIALQSLGLNEQASAELAEVLRLRPELAETRANLGNVLLETGQVAAAIENYREAIRLRPDVASIHSSLLYALHFDAGMTPQAICNEHIAWARRHAESHSRDVVAHENDSTPGRRLRIGYVTPDFRDHPVGRFMLPVLAEHDRERFEVHVFSDVYREDQITAKLRQHATHWHAIRPMNDTTVAALVRREKIDILVDLAGHSGVNRLLVFARKLAPVQVTYLGYPNTTGMSAMDYRITDALADPPGMEMFYVERLDRLAGGFLCYCPPDDPPEVADAPCARNGYVTFGSFNKLAKISPAVVALWAKILLAVEDSRLVIKSQGLGDDATRDRVRRQFAVHGIEANRLDVRGAESSHGKHLQAYQAVDIALDTFPYNGTTTTCEALMMGVPIIVLAGHAHVSRVGVSLLTYAGLEKWIAKDEAEYLRLATELARCRDWLIETRRGLRSTLLGSALCDAARFTRELEGAFLKFWDEHSCRA